jgi:hypothetical protein
MSRPEVELPPKRATTTRGTVTEQVTRRVVAALGEHRCIPIAKDDVIAYLAVTDWTADARELLYRDWCAVVDLPVERTDVRRARNGRRRETNRRFEW